jgi:protein-L-isoaspartate(D-aspartate) O-methyltransferase
MERLEAHRSFFAKLITASVGIPGYEIEERLAQRAVSNLEDLLNVTIHHRSGAEGPLPGCDVLYVSAGATAPLDVWLDALKPGGRLLFPLTPAQGVGGLLLITRTTEGLFNARFLGRVMFIPCVGARDDETAQKLTEAFKRDDLKDVRSLQRGTPPDETSWCSGNGWWLSTAPLA